MTRCPIRTRGRTARPGDAHETTTLLAGSSPQVRWICSGVPSSGPLLAALPSGSRGGGGGEPGAADGEHLSPGQGGPRVIWHDETLPSAGERLVTTGKVVV